MDALLLAGFRRNGWDMSWSGFDAVYRCDTALGIAQNHSWIGVDFGFTTIVVLVTTVLTLK